MSNRVWIASMTFILLAAIVRADLPSIGGGNGPTTQMAPAVGPSTDPAAEAPTTAPSVSYDQIDNAIAHGIDFLLSNFEKNELKHLDGEMGQIDHDGINDLCVYAVLKAG